MSDEFRRGSPLGAERLSGRVRLVRIESREAAVFHRRDGSAAGDAEATVAVDVLRAGVVSHDVAPPPRIVQAVSIS